MRIIVTLQQSVNAGVGAATMAGAIGKRDTQTLLRYRRYSHLSNIAANFLTVTLASYPATVRRVQIKLPLSRRSKASCQWVLHTWARAQLENIATKELQDRRRGSGGI